MNEYMKVITDAIINGDIDCAKLADGKLHHWKDRHIFVRKVTKSRRVVGYKVFDQGQPDSCVAYDTEMATLRIARI